VNAAPIIQKVDGCYVVRDDLFPGGSKARFLPLLFENSDEIVYATPAQGGAQSALAYTAKRLNKRVTLFVAKRKEPHERTRHARSLGARVFQVPCGYLTVVQARAKKYCKDTGATLAPFGLDWPAGIEKLCEEARQIPLDPSEVWCASGSGVLARSLKKAWPKADIHCVQVGRALDHKDVAGASIHVYPLPFNKKCPIDPPFPSDYHYDAKAWEICRKLKRRDGVVLFWNVTGPVGQNYSR
jgi:cysteine synthase